MGNYVANRKLVDQKMEKVQEDFSDSSGCQAVVVVLVYGLYSQ